MEIRRSEVPVHGLDDLPEISPNLREISLWSPLLMGLSAIFCSIGGLILWSCLATISSAVIVPGAVVVESGRKYVQHLTGGVLTDINVHDGQEVAKGQILMRLDRAPLELASKSLERLLAINIATIARLQAEQLGQSIITFPEQIADVTVGLRHEADKEQERIFEARRLSIAVKRLTFESDAKEAVIVAAWINNQIAAQTTRIVLTEKELASAVLLARSGYGTWQRVTDINRVLAELQGEMANLNSKKVDALHTYEHDTLEERQVSASFAESAGSELQQAEREKAELSVKLMTIQQQLATSDIRAPVAGLVVNMAFHTIGGVVGPGVTVLEIVPESDSLVLEANIRPDDMEDVSLGLPADIRLSGIGSERLLRLVGVVTRISADRLEDPIKATPFFRVRVEVPKSSLQDEAARRLRAGLAVTLMIRKGQQAPLAYLMSPLIGFFTRSLS